MDLFQLKYFVAVASEGSFTKASRRLFVSQPALSRQISDLEKEVGHSLFDRTSKRVCLTQKGVYLFEQAQVILNQVDDLKKELRNSDQLEGTISIGGAESPSADIVFRALSQFQKLNPKVKFEIRSSNALELIPNINNGLCDFGILNTPADIGMFNYLEINKETRWGVLVDENHPLAANTGIKPAELKELDLILSRQVVFQNQLTGWLGFPSSQLKQVGTYNLLFSASRAVKGSALAALCLEGIVETEGDSGLVFIPLEPAVSNNALLVWPKTTILNRACQAFLDYFRGILRDVQGD